MAPSINDIFSDCG
ncbi:hypothetical protein EYZ11_008996 [Aspergillus tanneri]|uniref:Uncharacterized protein n=1 Tax=Aspergillus tanneri TaxID=1220188 RepID=A0A4S3J901_9EURO|nr:hypothetical protein EYZ11_008996 [Aspergillus tanneri]